MFPVTLRALASNRGTAGQPRRYWGEPALAPDLHAANAFEWEIRILDFMHAAAAAGASIRTLLLHDDRIISTRTHSGVWSGVAVPVMYHTRGYQTCGSSSIGSAGARAFLHVTGRRSLKSLPESEHFWAHFRSKLPERERQNQKADRSTLTRTPPAEAPSLPGSLVRLRLSLLLSGESAPPGPAPSETPEYVSPACTWALRICMCT